VKEKGEKKVSAKICLMKPPPPGMVNEKRLLRLEKRNRGSIQDSYLAAFEKDREAKDKFRERKKNWPVFLPSSETITSGGCLRRASKRNGTENGGTQGRGKRKGL